MSDDSVMDGVFFYCQRKLKNEFDKVTRAAGYNKRTPALHEAMRLLITKLKEA